MQAIKRRRRLGAEAWRGLLARFVVSGLTVTAFCEREAVSAASFYRWRMQLGGQPLATARSALPTAVVSRAQTAFVDLGALTQASASSSCFELRLDLGGGLLLSLVRG